MSIVPEFIKKLQAQYEIGLANGNLFFTPTQLSYLDSGSGIRFEIRYAPSLSKKPINQYSESKPKPTHDPFLPPYGPDLFVCEFNDGEGVDEDSFVILLNKFCVVPRHFLMVTKQFESQNSPPSPVDLHATYLILDQAHLIEPQNEWIAFYNCGPQSGASQPHKHFQFLPAEKGSTPFGNLIMRNAPPKDGQIFSLPGLTYSHFIVLLPQLLSSGNPSTGDEILGELGKRFMGLLDAMIQRLRHLPDEEGLSKTHQGLSYNLVMTRSYMFLVPRSKQHFEDPEGARIDINSLGVGAGMILVKKQDELDRLNQLGVDHVVAHVTFPALAEPINPCDADGGP